MKAETLTIALPVESVVDDAEASSCIVSAGGEVTEQWLVFYKDYNSPALVNVNLVIFANRKYYKGKQIDDQTSLFLSYIKDQIDQYTSTDIPTRFKSSYASVRCNNRWYLNLNI